MLKQRNTFTNARATLTLWYCAILFFILFAFSMVLYTTETRNFARIVIQRNFGQNVPRILPNPELKELGAQLRALRNSFVFDLVAIDGIILLIGGGFSYFLAGKTLSPIQEVVRKQKAFLADASHELRTPLASMQIACEVVLRSPRKSKEDYRIVVQELYEETKQLSTIANDLLLLSRIDAGVADILMKPIPLSTITKEVTVQIKQLAKQKEQVLKQFIKSKVVIKGDKDRIKQLILILLDNAIKYTPLHGEISIILKVASRPLLIVSDTGIGISPEHQKHIFDRFYQVDASRSKSGAGLGLAIAQSIAQAHGAIIKVESKVGKGSTFTVVFSENTTR